MVKFQVGDVLSFHPRNRSIGFFRPISEDEDKEGKREDIQSIFKKAYFVKDDSSFQEFLVWLNGVFKLQFKETKVLNCNLAYEITFVPK